jgi:phosphopantothenate synthetase
MILAAKEIKPQQQGVPKQNFVKAIERMSDQVRRMDHQLELKVEHTIAAEYQNRHNEIRYIHMMIERMKETL